MKSSMLVVFLVAVFAVPAHAQRSRNNTNANTGNQQQQTADQKKKREAEDKDYKATIDRIPEQKSDPWSGIRPAPPSR